MQHSPSSLIVDENDEDSDKLDILSSDGSGCEPTMFAVGGPPTTFTVGWSITVAMPKIKMKS